MTTTGHIKWLKDCQVCNDGLCSQMNGIMEKQKISENNAATVLADMVERQVGYPIYTAKQLRDRFRYHTNKDKKKRVAEFPQPEEGATPKTTAPKGSHKKAVLKPKVSSDSFQDLKDSAQFLAEGLRSWADGTIKPQSDPEVKAAQAIKDTAVDIIAQYARLDIDVKGIYETESQHRITKKEGTHGLD